MAIADWVNGCIVFLGYMEEDRFVPEGTGFIASYECGGLNFLHLVTAQHLIPVIQRHAPKVIVRINAPNGQSTFLGSIEYQDFYFHPDDDAYVDVAVSPIGLKHSIGYTAVNFSQDIASEAIIKEKAIGPGDRVHIAGYFRYHAGKFRNLPIVRTGNIAAMPNEPIVTRQGIRMDAYLIEARSIGGLSGSPVFVDMEPIRVIENRAVLNHGKRHYLLGVMHGHYDERNEELMENAGRIERVNTGIGVVTPVEKIMQTFEGSDLSERRNKHLKELQERAANLTEDSMSDDPDQRAVDEILLRMLKTPPKPNKSEETDT